MRAQWEYFGKEGKLDGFQGVLQLLEEDVGVAALQFSSLRDDTDDDFMMRTCSIVCLVGGWGTWKTRAGLSLMAASPQPPACTCRASSEHQFFSQDHPELQKRANCANQLVLFFLAGANFWEKHAKNRQKHAKTGEKQALFWC